MNRMDVLFWLPAACQHAILLASLSSQTRKDGFLLASTAFQAFEAVSLLVTASYYSILDYPCRAKH